MTPLLASSIAIDSIQCVLSGVARGCGWQHLAAWTNLGCFYVIGVPISTGLWMGLVCGLACQAGILLLITLHRKWTGVDLSSKKEEEETPNSV
ncbi:hypothetical protein CRYUN_Cryun21dG0117000 [Craigia yunnanensis]